MNAKMMITVPISEIPNEVNKMLYGINIRLEEESKKILSAIEEKNYSEKIKIIDEIRKNLTLVDLNLEDSYNVLIGYVKYEAQRHNPTQNAQQEDPSNESNING